MSAKGTKTRYIARIEPDTLPALQDLATDLGIFADVPGRHYGDPSPPGLLDALAAAYRANPTAVTTALRALGIAGDGPPPPR
ncbi:MAG: hypothetical protein KF770_10595 [Anaerolineae bacterium]|nr:hypothetical protein [Anaerolineae bacterium]